MTSILAVTLSLPSLSLTPVTAALTRFEDGFESGNFNAWTGTNSSSGGTIDIQDSVVHSGSWAAIATVPEGNYSKAHVYQSITLEPVVYAGAWFQFSGVTPNEGDHVAVINFSNDLSPATTILTAGYANNGGTISWYLRYSIDGGTNTFYSADTIDIDTWYWLELAINVDESGWNRLYVNGVEEIIRNTNNTRHGNVGVVRIGRTGDHTPENYAIDIYFDDCAIDDAYLGPNNEPYINDLQILNMDRTNDLYARKRAYNFQLTVTDLDGIADLDTGQIAFNDGVNWCNVSINLQTTVGTITSGAEYISLGTITTTASGNTANYTVPLTLDWDINDASIDLYAWVNDTENANATWYQIHSNYATIESDVNVLDFALSDDRGNIGGTLYSSGTITYQDSPITVPTGQVSAVVIYNSTNHNVGSGTPTAGFFNISITAGDIVGEETYNTYLDMVSDDGDYEDSTTDTFIADQIVVYYEELNATQMDAGEPVEYRVRALLDYDDSLLGSGDVVEANAGTMTWDVTNAWFEVAHTELTTTNYTFQVTSARDNTYGITAIEAEQPHPTGMWVGEIDSLTLDVQAQDNDGTDLPRSVTFKVLNATTGTLVTEQISATSGAATLNLAPGNYTIETWWGSYYVGSTNHTLSANATVPLVTFIERLNSGDNYLLAAINGTEMSDLSLVGDTDWDCPAFNGTGVQYFTQDHTNWVTEQNPAQLTIVDTQANATSANWSYTAFILEYPIDFDAHDGTVTLAMTFEEEDVGLGFDIRIPIVIGVVVIAAAAIYLITRRR
ncbi:MAG: hypothetical protein NWE83_04290 [Candidatus Bathyarchaeota archaeon]|nr:hypothetical protein [Candidatus Bathyarchaeota archaeon]